MPSALAKVAQGFDLKRALNVAAMAVASMVALIGLFYSAAAFFGTQPWWYASALSGFAAYGTYRLVQAGWGSLAEPEASGGEVS